MSASFTVERGGRASRMAAVLGAVIVAGLVAAPFFADRAALRLLIEIFYFTALAQMWSLLAGYGGLVSVGQQAFVGFGGYMLFIGCKDMGLHPLMALPLAGIATLVIAAPSALVAFRLKGAYFAIGTWVIAEVFRLSFAQISALGGGSGLSLPISSVRMISSDRAMVDSVIYWVGLGIMLAAIGTVYLLLRSRWGMAMTAIRDSEDASQSLGVEAYRTKFIVYLAVAGMTGLIGALIFLVKLRISPNAAFSLTDWTALIIFVVVIGGIGTIEGPIIGVLLYFGLRSVAADWGGWYLILLGAVAVAVMLKAPRGIWGLICERYELQLFAVQRRLVMKDQGK